MSWRILTELRIKKKYFKKDKNFMGSASWQSMITYYFNGAEDKK
jgi:hypothetical protein